MYLNKETGKYEAKITIKDVDYQGQYKLVGVSCKDIYGNSVQITNLIITT